LFAGWEKADSVVMNPHKWLFTPIDCSALFTRRPDVLKRAFSLVPEYLRSDVAARKPEVRGDYVPVDLMDYGIQLGRRFRALKLWLVFRTYGKRGLQARLRHHIEMAEELAGWIDDHPDFERLAPTPFSTLPAGCRTPQRRRQRTGRGCRGRMGGTE
jgi:aromatic-L-amino-acid decarboxylase